MEIRGQIIDLVEKFLIIADNLLRDGKIDKQTYEFMTHNKIKFLKLVNNSEKHFMEQSNE